MPTDTYLTEQLYPQLRKLIKGMSQEDAVNTLMGCARRSPTGMMTKYGAMTIR